MSEIARTCLSSSNLPLAPGSARARRAVEVVLDRALAPPGDDQDVRDARAHGLLDHVLDGRLVDDRQHLLGLRLGGGQEPRAEPGGRDDRLADLHGPSTSVRPASGSLVATRRRCAPGSGAYPRRRWRRCIPPVADTASATLGRSCPLRVRLQALRPARSRSSSRFTDDALTTCPECGGPLRKVFAPAGHRRSRARASTRPTTARESSALRLGRRSRRSTTDDVDEPTTSDAGLRARRARSVGKDSAARSRRVDAEVEELDLRRTADRDGDGGDRGLRRLGLLRRSSRTPRGRRRHAVRRPLGATGDRRRRRPARGVHPPARAAARVPAPPSPTGRTCGR